MSASRTRFLQRRSYRHRRIADAARLLPLAGIILVLLPLLRLGQEGVTQGARTSQVGLYIFAVWVLLMVVAFGLSRGLKDPKDLRTERSERAEERSPVPREDAEA